VVRLDSRIRADVAIVGAGFTGLSTALHLAERGCRVAVLDAQSPGWGASGRNGGQVIPGLKFDPRELTQMLGAERGRALARFTGDAAGLLFGLIERYGIDCDAVRSGWIQGATDRVGLDRATARAADWLALGAEAAMLGQDEIRAMVGGGAYLGGWIDRRGGHVQPLSLARGMAAAGQARGVEIYGESAARGVVRQGNGWEVRTDRGTVLCDEVVIGTNGYTGELWPGLRRSIVATTSLQVATDILPDAVRRSILPGNQAVSETRNHLHYYRLHESGRLVFGGSGGFRDPAPADFAALFQAALGYFPQLAGSPAHAWFGRFANTPDHLPHLHVLAPGVFTWLGCQGRGVALSTAMGSVLARLALGERPEDLPVPVTQPKPIPFHGLQSVYVAAFERFYAWQDRLRGLRT
jgi:glycine/D-amino acid oxidase-like deaminating enzyme